MHWIKVSGIAATALAAALIALPATAVTAVPAVNKGDVTTPAFTPAEAETIDDHLNRLNAHGYLPFAFVVTDIQPAPDDYAGSTVSIPQRPWTPPGPIALAGAGQPVEGHPRNGDDAAQRDLVQREPFGRTIFRPHAAGHQRRDELAA